MNQNNAKVLDSNVKKEGKTVVVTKTIEETMDLLRVNQYLDQVRAQKNGVAQQLAQIQETIDHLNEQEKELNELKELLEKE